MPASLDDLDRLIADTELAILEQVLRIVSAEAAGQSTETAKRALRAVEGILIEYRRARDLIIEARKLTRSQKKRKK